MTGSNLADALYFELLTISILLILQMLYNNLVSFKKKMNDSLSVMLIGCIIMAVLDIIWKTFEGRPGSKVINYVAAIGYAIMLLVVAENISLCSLDKLQIKLKSKRYYFFLYVLPLIVVTVLMVSTPWTNFFYTISEDNVIDYTDAYFYFYNVILYSYAFSGMVISIYMWIFKYKKVNDAYKIARSFMIFVVGILGLFLMQDEVLQVIDDNYISMTVAITVPLVFLTTDLNIISFTREEAKNAAITADLDTASKIQHDALPFHYPAFPDHLNVSLTAFMKTAKEVGGDFYDYFTLDEKRVCFLIADVSGKGIPAALFMMTVKTMIQDYARAFPKSTSDIFTEVNKRICESSKSGMFATAWIGIIDTTTMTLQYTNAGHNYPLLARAGEHYEILKKKHGLFLAGMDDTVYKMDEIPLNQGDRLFLYTDGLTEAHNVNAELYGTERLTASLESLEGTFVMDDMEKIVADIEAFAGQTPQFDDMTMVMVEII